MSINVDPDSLDNRKLAAIAKNPKHPLHTHAKSIMDRRRGAQQEHAEHMGEGAMKRMATNETEPKPEKNKGMETFRKKKQKMDEAMLTRKQISRAAAIGAAKAKPKDQVTLKKAPWEKDKKEVKEYGGPPISRAKYLKQKPMMGEKHLTSNEKKKREEIAQAIKRDNPNMPMAKKMAIATATAKRVAEEVEYPHPMYDPKTGKKVMAKSPADHNKYDKMGYTHDKPDMNELSMSMKDLSKTGLSKKASSVDKDKLKKDLAKLKKGVNEVSSNTLANYMRKSSADAGKPGASARRQDKRIGGQKMADDKIRKKMGQSSSAKVPAGMNEDDASARMYRDNPDMMKQQGPGGFKSLDPKMQKTIKKAMKKLPPKPTKEAHDSEGIKAMKKAGNAKAAAERQEGSARDRLMAIVNKAGNRTMADREADAKKAAERRKAADKDLADFRKKNIGMS